MDFKLPGAAFSMDGIHHANGRGMTITGVTLHDGKTHLEFRLDDYVREGTRVYITGPKDVGEVARLRLVESSGWWSSVREVPLC